MSTSRPVPSLSYEDESGQHRVPLSDAETTLGRSPGQTVVRDEVFVSRQHAKIVRGTDGFEVIDQNSTHGTYLNGQRVQRSLLRPNDVLQLGSLQAPPLRFSAERGEFRGLLAEEQTGVSDLLQTLSGMRPPGEERRRSPVREMEQLNFLLRAARTLNAGEARQDVLRALLQLSLQFTGVERGFVYLCEGAEMPLALGLHADGRVLTDDFAVSKRAIQRAIESGSRFSVEDTLSDQSAGSWTSVVLNRIRTLYCIPLRKRAQDDSGRLLGLLYLDSQQTPGRLSEVDHQLLDAIATEAAALLHNALLAEAEHKARQAREELAMAAGIHAGLMSITLPRLPFAELCARSVPCLAIGGDFYDAVALQDSVGITIADISGKGVSSAIVAATLQGIIHAQMLAGQELAEIGDVLNQFLCTRQVGRYATLVMAKLFPDGRLQYLNCGHIPPVLIREGHLEQMLEGSMVVGLIAGARYSSAWTKLRPGDRVLLTTDGITEAENLAGEVFGETELEKVARDSCVDEMLDRVSRFLGPCEAQDDRTLMEVRYTG